METIIFYIVSFIVLIKWIITITLICILSINNYRELGHNNIFIKILSLPMFFLDKFLSQPGGERFVIYNISTFPLMCVRRFIYKMLGAHIDKNVIIHFKTEIREPSKLYLGEGTIIGDNAILDARCGLNIGKNVNLSSNVSIYTLQHDHRDPYFRCQNSNEKRMNTEIGDRVWLGSNVIVLPGVTIGEGAVCCAGCVVTKNVKPFSIVAGIPAKEIGQRNNNLKYKLGTGGRFY